MSRYTEVTRKLRFVRKSHFERFAAPWRSPRTRLVSAAAAFCFGGLLYSLVLGDGTRYPDEADYLALARHALEGLGYSLDGTTPYTERSPGYVWALAPLLIVYDSIHAVRLSQFAALVLCAVLLADIAARSGHGALRSTLHRADIAVLLLGGIAAYPVLIYTAGTLFPQTFIALGLVGVLWLLEVPEPKGRTALAAGLLAGWVTELSPNALAILPIGALHLALSERWSPRQMLPYAAGASFVIGLWTLRNLLLTGEFIPFADNLTTNLQVSFAHTAALEGIDWETAVDGFSSLSDRATQLLSAPTVYLANLGDHFTWHNELSVAEEWTPLRGAVMYVTYHVLLMLVALRLALVPIARLARIERTLLSLYVATACFHALVFARLRWRLPFDLLLLLPALEALLICRAHWYRRIRTALS